MTTCATVYTTSPLWTKWGWLALQDRVISLSFKCVVFKAIFLGFPLLNPMGVLNWTKIKWFELKFVVFLSTYWGISRCAKFMLVYESYDSTSGKTKDSLKNKLPIGFLVFVDLNYTMDWNLPMIFQISTLFTIQSCFATKEGKWAEFFLDIVRVKWVVVHSFCFWGWANVSVTRQQHWNQLPNFSKQDKRLV